MAASSVPLDDVPDEVVLSVLDKPDVLEPVRPEDKPPDVPVVPAVPVAPEDMLVPLEDVPDEPVADVPVLDVDGAAVPLRSSGGFICVLLGSFAPVADGAPPADVP